MILGARFFFSEGIYPVGVEMTQCQANSALGSQGKKDKKKKKYKFSPYKYHLLVTTITEYTEECSLFILN